jgi:hypothetical protein
MISVRPLEGWHHGSLYSKAEGFAITCLSYSMPREPWCAFDDCGKSGGNRAGCLIGPPTSESLQSF